MKSIFLIENNTPVVAMVEMEKPNVTNLEETWEEFNVLELMYQQHLATATHHELIGKIPDEWVVGCEVDVELGYQINHTDGMIDEPYTDVGKEKYYGFYKELDLPKRIVAKPLTTHPTEQVQYENGEWSREVDEDLVKPLPVGEEKNCICTYPELMLHGNKDCDVHGNELKCPPVKQETDRWVQGYVCAVTCMIQLQGGVETACKEMFQSGIGNQSLDELASKGVDGFDLEKLKKHWIELTNSIHP